jgi:hypothetical protein
MVSRMNAHLGQVLRDPLTGDKGRVVGFAHDGSPLAKTEGGRLFTGGKDVRGQRQSLSARYFAGDLKVCNCAGCREVLLGTAHKEELRIASITKEDTTGVPPLVAGRIDGRPYCHGCLGYIEAGIR